eukprot:2953306-Amphidinium_carterae.1
MCIRDRSVTEGNLLSFGGGSHLWKGWGHAERFLGGTSRSTTVTFGKLKGGSKMSAWTTTNTMPYKTSLSSPDPSQ